jgi:hypothetical protein
MSGEPESDDGLMGYVHFDEREDVLASLDLLKLLTPILEECPAYWKWVILAAENALQGAMVCALLDSTGTSVLRRDSRVKMLDWLQDRGPERGDRPRGWLAAFDELLEACIGDLGLTLSGGQLRDIKRLHEYFRNKFVHFTPKGWGIEKAGLPRIIGAALYATEDLMGRDQVQRHMIDAERRRMKKALSATRASLGL